RNLVQTFDEVDRLQDIQEGASIIASHTYEGGKTARIDLLNGADMTQQFDGAQRTTQLDHKKGLAVIGGFQYAYNKEHRKKYENRTHVGQGDAYNVDGIYRLTGSKFGVASADFSPTKNYADYLTFSKEKTFTLDATANRKEVNDGGAITKYNDNMGYSPDLMNEYFKIGGTSQAHDDNGNLTDDGTYTYEFDYRNQLIEIVRKSDLQVMSLNLYDAKNRRVKRTDDAGVVTYFCWDGWRVIEERDSVGAVLATYVYGNGIDELVSMNRGGSTYYYHRNHIGSIYHVTDASGNIVERYDYSPYGIPTIYTGAGADSTWNTSDDVSANSSAIGNPYMFQGRRYEGASLGSVYYWRNRWYDAERGRWIQRDPKGLYGDRANFGNAYGAFGGDPVNGVDPFGLNVKPWGLTAGELFDAVSDGVESSGPFQAVKGLVGGYTESVPVILKALRDKPVETLKDTAKSTKEVFVTEPIEEGSVHIDEAVTIATSKDAGFIDSLRAATHLVLAGAIAVEIATPGKPKLRRAVKGVRRAGKAGRANKARKRKKRGGKIPNKDLKGPPKKRGRPPKGSDGHSVELHHRGQRADSQLDEMTRTDHRLGSNFKKNHPNTGKKPSKIDRKEFAKDRKKHWQREWDSGRFKDLDKK
ncbi:hypothetical protein JYT15_01050, partial [Acidimicrobium ferrooxidans]|nr:hypothetical protein [Acidimicrobium ferrooxidans]